MVYKWCIVPQCRSTSIKNPNKLFVSVPSKVKRRDLWLQLAGRHPKSIGINTSVYMCEDHFDMEKDIKNYLKYKMGFARKLLLTDEAVPTKFHCQDWERQLFGREFSQASVSKKKRKRKLVTKTVESQPVDDVMIEVFIEPKEEFITSEEIEECLSDVDADVSTHEPEPEGTMETDIPRQLMVCRSCLTTDRKLFRIEANNLKVPFQEIVGNSVMAEFALSIRSWCAQLLSKYKQFRERCRHADVLLQNWYNDNTLTTDFVKSVDIAPYNLNLKLTRSETVIQASDDHAELKSENGEIDIKEEIEIEEDVDTASQETDEDEKNNVRATDTVKSKHSETVDASKSNHIEINHMGFTNKSAYEYFNAKDNSDTDSVDMSDIEQNFGSVNENNDTMYCSEPEIEVRNYLEAVDSEDGGAAKSTEVDPLDTKYTGRNQEVDDGRVPRKKMESKKVYSIADRYNMVLIDLTKEQQLIDMEAKRKSNNYLKSKHRCVVCAIGFLTEKEFTKHRDKTHDLNVGKYVCELCKSRFATKFKLNLHLCDHRYRWQCKKCNFTTTLPWSAKYHHYWHEGVNISCHYCDKKFSDMPEYCTHLWESHPETSVWCRCCGESFLNTVGLSNHARSMHDNLVRCEDCGNEFVSEKALEVHNSVVCVENSCAQCGDGFPMESLLKIHILNHKGGTVWKCDICSVAFKSHETYQRHFEMSLYMCKIVKSCSHCGECFSTSMALRRHIARYHMGKMVHPNKWLQYKYECERCHAKYKSMSSLNKHKMNHTAEHSRSNRNYIYLNMAESKGTTPKQTSLPTAENKRKPR